MYVVSVGTNPASPGVTLWLLPDQVAFARRLLTLAGCHAVRVGCPLKGQSVASAMDAEPFDDLRAELAAPQAPITLLLTAQGFAEGDAAPDDLRALGATSPGVRTRVVSLEPVPSGIDALLQSARFLSPDQVPQMLALPRRCPSLLAGQDWIESLGGVKAASLRCWARPGEGTLAALLTRAFDLLMSTMGEPESIDASFIQPGTVRGLHAAPGETLAGLEGAAAGIARFADGRCASFFAHDRAAATGFEATLVGPGGQLALDPSSCTWRGRADPGQQWGTPDEGSATERQIAQELIAAVQGDGSTLPPISIEQLLVMGQTSLLSTRTGVPESPETIRKMSRAT